MWAGQGLAASLWDVAPARVAVAHGLAVVGSSGMRSLWIAACLLGACGGPSRGVVPTKPPNDELILGAYERHPPDGTTAMRFRADGSVRLARTQALLDTEPPLATGTWKIDGTTLTLTYDQGMCTEAPGDKTGVYTVVVSRIGVHFTKLDDRCARRATIDGQTWWRLK